MKSFFVEARDNFIKFAPLVTGALSLLKGIGAKSAFFVYAGLASIVLSFLLFFRVIRIRQLPWWLLFKKIEFTPAFDDEIDKIIALDKRVFAPDDIVSETTFLAWHQKNSRVITVLRYKGSIVGYYALLPLSEKALEAVRRGYLRYEDIKATDVLKDSQMRKSHAIYFFSIVSKTRHTRLARLLIRHAVYTLNKMNKHGNLREVYASAATNEGERLLRRFKFQRIDSARERADRHNLYYKDIGSHNDLVECLPNNQVIRSGMINIAR